MGNCNSNSLKMRYCISTTNVKQQENKPKKQTKTRFLESIGEEKSSQCDDSVKSFINLPQIEFNIIPQDLPNDNTTEVGSIFNE